jgi:hypothetical protein
MILTATRSRLIDFNIFVMVLLIKCEKNWATEFKTGLG